MPLAYFAWRFATSGDRGFGADGLWDAVRTSVLSASISTVLVLVLGVPLAHWLASSQGAFARIVTVAVQLPLALPPVMSGIVLLYVVGPYTWLGTHLSQNLTQSLAGVVIAQTFVAAPFLIIAARSAFAERDLALDDLAATLGHRRLGRFLRVDLRLALGGIRAGALLTWLRALGEYGATVLLAYHPYTLPIFTSVQFSASGLPSTQAPTALALAVAVVGLLLVGVHLPTRRHHARMPKPLPAPARAPTVVSFAIDYRVGTFHLQLAHQGSSSRLAILGPSGAGKSMALQAIGGLLAQDSEVTYAGERVDQVPVEAREVGYVPQNRGVFPHLDVWSNATFGVGSDPALAAWWLRTLELEDLVDRYPHELSGGQRQRVALAQALSHQPRVVLLDEPFSALDAPVRTQLQTTVRRLQREEGLSTVLVTHDPIEAALLADEVLVIADGRLLQSGSTSEVYRRPNSATVARLLGIPNFADGVVLGDGQVQVGDCVFDLPPNVVVGEGDSITWCVRPQDLALSATGRHPAVVRDLVELGSHVAVTLDLGTDARVSAMAREAGWLEVGHSCRFDVDPARTLVWPAPHGDILER